jgi:hypothetical protein
MKCVVETSVGRVVLDFYGDSIVQVIVLDAEGWEASEGEWGDAEVGRGLFYIAGVPEDEAARIEQQVLAQWRARGGNPSGRWEDDQHGAVVAAGIGALLLGLVGSMVVGVITIVRALTRWLA